MFAATLHPGQRIPGYSVLWLAFCLISLGLPCPAQRDQSTMVSVVGKVTTEGGQPIPRSATVTVQGDNGTTVGQQSVDSQGHFQIDNLASGRRLYRLIVKAEGYYPAEQSLNLRGGRAVVTVEIVLTRVSESAKSEAPLLTDMNAPRKARKAFAKGARELDARHLPEAQRDFAAAVADYPCYARAQTALAAVLISKRDLPAAEAALRKAIQCDSGFVDSFASLGRILNSENRFSESEAVLEQGLRTSPGDWVLYDELASAHYNQGLYPQAADEWLRAVSLSPNAPSELHTKLAAAYLRQGNTGKAYSEMQTYLRLDPDGRFAAQARSLMRQIETSSSATELPAPKSPQ